MIAPTKLTGRIAIICYQHGSNLRLSHRVVGISKDDTEQSIRDWFLKSTPNAWIRSVTIEEDD